MVFIIEAIVQYAVSGLSVGISVLATVSQHSHNLILVPVPNQAKSNIKPINTHLI